MSGPHCDAIIHRSVPQACPAPADHQGFYNLPRDQTARDGTRHRSKESQRNLCSFGLNTFYKLNKLRGPAADCGYCALSIVRWPGPGRWQDILQLCRFICAGCWRLGLARLAECLIIQILKASVSSLILFSFPPFGQTGAEKININEAGSLLFSDYI